MFKFLSVLFSVRKKKVTVILVQENKPAEPESFSFYPKRLFQLNLYIILLTLALVFVLLTITPMGATLFDKEDAELRAMAVDLSNKISFLSDSLKKRDVQLKSIQEIIRAESDTVFQTIAYESLIQDYIGTDAYEASYEVKNPEIEIAQTINADKIIYTGKFSSKPVFPAPSPLVGTLSQKFAPEKKHFGIDIAASKGTIARSISDGVVVSADWSINYGNTIQIQHGDGYISIIKHFSSLLKKEGDIVLKGDGIGVLGLSGVINSGPHIHIELWHNGVALDPELYLITQ